MHSRRLVQPDRAAADPRLSLHHGVGSQTRVLILGMLLYCAFAALYIGRAPSVAMAGVSLTSS